MSAEKRKEQRFVDENDCLDEVSRIARRLAPHAPSTPSVLHSSRPYRSERTRAWPFMLLFMLAATPSAALLALALTDALQIDNLREPKRMAAALASWSPALRSPGSSQAKRAPNRVHVQMDFPDHIATSPNQHTAFRIKVDSSDVLPSKSHFKIYGLPAGTAFSAGRPLNDTGWGLLLGEVADFRLALPPTAQGDYEVVVKLVMPDGNEVARRKTRLVVIPSRKAEQVARHESLGRIDDLIARGQRMVAVGYLAGARAYFRRAAEAGSAKAALALGATYDEALILETGARGIKPNRAVAQAWYDRAKKLGLNEADAVLGPIEAAGLETGPAAVELKRP